MEEGLEGKGEAGSQIGKEGRVVVSGGREFETRQYRELGESDILIDLSMRESHGVSSGVVSH
jgi:hypothetical protein